MTTFNRGHTSATADARVERLIGNRLDQASLAQLTGRDWDLVTDTWAGAPSAARASATALAGHAARYAYISSGSVYTPPAPFGGDESAPTVRLRPAPRMAPIRSASAAPSSRSCRRLGNARCWRGRG